MRIKVTADSTCDLSPELYRGYDVTPAPLSVMIGGEVRHDGVDVTPRDIFTAVEAGKSVKTAAVNEYEYEQLFRNALKDHDEVLHLTISKHMSTCYTDAENAARKVGHVTVADTKNLSTGSGLLVLKAVEMARQGLSPAEILKEITALRDKVDASFIIPQIDYLYRGGRCSGLEAAGAKLLHIRPSIEVSDGRMSPGKKYRGSYEHYLKHYIADRLEQADKIDFSRVFITHSPCEEGMVPYTIELVKSYGLFREVIDTTAGCTVCTHCGPNTLGILFLRK